MTVLRSWSRKPLRAAQRILFAALLLASSTVLAGEPPSKTIELKAPRETTAGAEVEVSYTGSSDPMDFISIDKTGAPDRDYGHYQYVKSGNPLKLRAPDEPGEYQIRYHLGKGGYDVVGSAPLRVKDVQAKIDAPAKVDASTSFEVTFSGPNTEGDFVAIDRSGAADRDYGAYVYSKNGSPAKLRAPDEPGDYVLRYHLGQTYRVVASKPIQVGGAEAKIEAPPSVAAGSDFTFEWTGPNNDRDFVSIDKAGIPDREYGPYAYTKDGSPAKLRAPDEPGDYALRYHLGQSYKVIAAAPVRVGGTDASVKAPASAPAGSAIEIGWTGPNGEGDFISVDTSSAADRDYGAYAYTKDGNPVTIRVPEDPGEYTVRYHTGQTYRVLAKQTVRADPVTATVEGPAKVEAGAKFEAAWNGPNNPEDYIALASKDAPGKDSVGYAYTRRGTPARLQAPKKTGPYEIRYVTGQKNNVLARTAIEVVAGTTPGTLRVTSAKGDDAGGGAVELILDASGSMLQRLGGKRRIDLAKAALLELTQDALPAGSPFALRVFGHRQADSCRTDLEIPLAPLDRKAATAKIKGIEAKNLAKTPIGASLLHVKEDLAGVNGGAIVVLVTDGEETCDGNPEEAIRTLRGAGYDVRINIVGFAVEEVALKEDFQTWARLGGGNYFDAGDGEALAQAIRASLRLPFQVEKDGAVVASGVVNGGAVEVPPGTYLIKVLSNPPRAAAEVTIVTGEETVVKVE